MHPESCQRHVGKAMKMQRIGKALVLGKSVRKALRKRLQFVWQAFARRSRRSQGVRKAFARRSQGVRKAFTKAFAKRSQGVGKMFAKRLQGVCTAFARSSKGVRKPFARRSQKRLLSVCEGFAKRLQGVGEAFAKSLIPVRWSREIRVQYGRSEQILFESFLTDS